MMATLEHRLLKVREAQQMPIAQVLKEFVREGELYRRLDDNKVECFSCGHRCIIFDGLPGVCRVRFNEGGKLYVPWGYVGALSMLTPLRRSPSSTLTPERGL
jgi:pyruvate formate lyase activating enzyme